MKNILVRALIALIPLMLSSSGARAQLAPTSETDWKAIPNLWSMGEASAMQTAADLMASAEGTGTSSVEAVHSRVMALVLARRFLPDCEPTQDRCMAAQESVRRLEAKILSSGGDPATIARSAASLEQIVGKRPAVVPYRLPSRPATAAERRLLVQAVLSRLIDSTSSIFGAAHIVGDKAYLTVNSKNMMGGYTGSQEVMIIRIAGEWRAGGSIDISHEECVSTLTQR